ncbi:MAG TPA: gamma-glutamyl-gamma-aminobutyrate hydrolase family protein [Hyphomicrobiaceae bacterium]|nr:gamma-glutamyl-gamma-aminobutyrate hydrolase family protein [Hyphomicrobiaceae bacterium]
MRIAITMMIVNAAGYAEPRDAISHDWLRWLEVRGHDALPVPNSVSSPESYLDVIDAEGIIFSGGNDIVPDEDGRAHSELRNAVETRLLAAAIKRSLPVLGVCRGLHLINHHFGGAISLDIRGGAVEHIAANHEVSLAAPFRRYAGAATIETNSYHKQGVLEDGVAGPLVAFAWSLPDRLVEGLYHPERPILALQWHPERVNLAASFDEIVVARLFDEGAFWQG